ncbi:MAG: beta-phosphoglucomutase family hydrolase [Deltaproteobacteria bacterium]|nr:beta-phosphoglucomutase family hydrolase [Deltaproteobacteria bacterium]
MIRAALFDLDGTLVDNMRYHFAAWRKTAAALGVTLDDRTIQREFAGKKNDEIIPIVLGRAASPAEIANIAWQKESAYRDAYAAHVALVPGALALIDALRARGMKTAIASAAPPENRAMVLDALMLRARFDAIAGGEECKRGKPWPDIFLLAAERVGVAPAECVVFEDAVLGVKAAVAAGAVVVGVTTVEPAHALLGAGARMTIKDFVDAALSAFLTTH